MKVSEHQIRGHESDRVTVHDIRNLLWSDQKNYCRCTCGEAVVEILWSIFGQKQPECRPQCLSLMADTESQRGINEYCINYSWVMISVCYGESFSLELKADSGSKFSALLLTESCRLILLTPLVSSVSSRMFGSVIYLSGLGSQRLLRQQAKAYAEALPLQLWFLLR